MKLRSKDLLDIESLAPDEIRLILDTAVDMKRIVTSGMKKANYLQGKTVVTLFYENSTRTRVSFELAAKYLGAQAVNVAVASSSVAKGETLLDTGRTLDAMGTDILVMRHGHSGAPHHLSRHIRASVVNAGDGMHAHPTQALLDAFTMREGLGRLEGLVVAILGDVLHSRVARSNMLLLTKMGATVRVAGPSTLMAPGIEAMGASVCASVEEAVAGAHVIMALRLQMERQKHALFPSASEYAHFFGLTPDKVKGASPGALWMHPGPVNRGVEMPSSLVDGAQSVIDTQVTNGVAIRMAILYLLTGREEQ
jgi:aspartate carbamoyltransferase catalytic subunit